MSRKSRRNNHNRKMMSKNPATTKINDMYKNQEKLFNSLSFFIEERKEEQYPTIVGKAKNAKEYILSHFSGLLEENTTGEKLIKNNWKSLPLYKAKAIMNSNKYPSNMDEYIQRSREHHKNTSHKDIPFGSVFHFYQSDIDIVYAVDENDRVYSCGKDGIKISNRGFDCMWHVLSEREAFSFIFDISDY